jgi:glycosyltransferase involved in cell wall biosynthesis
MIINKNVCMFVYNNFLNDSRVKKEAQTLINAGYRVTVIAMLDAKTIPDEEIDQIRIIRVPLDPWHLRFFHWIQNAGHSNLVSYRQDRMGNRKIFSINYHLSKYAGWLAGKINFFAPAGWLLNRFSIRKVTKTALYLVFLIVLFELHFFTELLDWITDNRILFYFTLCVLIFLRGHCLLLLRKLRVSLKRAANYLFNLPKRIQLILSKRIKRSLINALKRMLIPFHRHFCFLAFYRNAYRMVEHEKFNVFHAHDLNTLPVAYLSAIKNDAKLVYDSHELYIERNKLKPSSKVWKFILGKIEGFLIEKTDAVFTVNETIAEEMAKRYKIDKPGVVMNTPASINTMERCLRFNGSLRSELSVPEQYRMILYIGAITFNRGLEELIKSLQYLPDCYLVYMGYGSEPFKSRLLDIVQKIDVADRFSFFGPVPSEQVIHYAADADVGVAPIANACMSYYYCSPNKLFEYMNAGLPVAASNFPELEKVVIGHEIGTSFNPADPRDIADSIRQILDDAPTREKMAQNAVRASKLYNWEIESKKLLKIYSGL